MKRRWTILFFIALSPLIGLSWLASKIGFSMWDTFNLGMLGLLVAAAASCYAAIRAVPTKWPAIVTLVASLPMFRDVMRVVDMIGEVVRWFGPSFVLICIGSIATTVTSAVLLVLAPPKPPSDPVAPARVVD